MREPGTRDPDATRASLLEAGLELFAERGYDGATIERIARRAGVNKAMISYHFGGKAGLHRAILESQFDWLLERLAPLRDETLPPEASLGRYVEIFGELHAKHPHLSRMLLREILAGGSRLEEPMLARVLEVFGTIHAILDRGVREGVFRPVDPLLTHLTVVGSIVFFFASADFRQRVGATGRLGVPLPALEAFVPHLHDLIRHGLEKEP